MGFNPWIKVKSKNISVMANSYNQVYIQTVFAVK